MTRYCHDTSAFNAFYSVWQDKEYTQGGQGWAWQSVHRTEPFTRNNVFKKLHTTQKKPWKELSSSEEASFGSKDDLVSEV